MLKMLKKLWNFVLSLLFKTEDPISKKEKEKIKLEKMLEKIKAKKEEVIAETLTDKEIEELFNKKGDKLQ